MNPRIRELAEQAEFSEKDLHIQGDNFQMFAELIVCECIDAVYDDGQDAEYYQDRIKRRFGVAE
jgi:hypothetical protein